MRYRLTTLTFLQLEYSLKQEKCLNLGKSLWALSLTHYHYDYLLSR